MKCEIYCFALFTYLLFDLFGLLANNIVKKKYDEIYVGWLGLM